MTRAYCGTCGGRFGHDIESPATHDCPLGTSEPGWCEACGAELTDTGICDNDHTDEDPDGH